MSSIVKKSSHFTPKLKKRAVRKESTATPPASQISEDISGSGEIAKQSGKVEINQQSPLSPPASQTQAVSEKSAAATTTTNTPTETSENGVLAATRPTEKTPQNGLFNYSIAELSSAKKPAAEPIVDPMSKAPGPPETAIMTSDHESEGEYGENDIFKQSAAPEKLNWRRPSMPSHRRLSGINITRRLSTVSTPGTPGFNSNITGSGFDSETTNEAPVTIGVPMGKLPRKRRASSSSSSWVKPGGRKSVRGSVVAISPVTDSLKEKSAATEAAEVAPESETATSSTNTNTNTNTTTQPAGPVEDYVIGICDKTGKLRKFKTGLHVEGHLPLAPANLVTAISSVRQLPRKIKPEDEELFARISVQTDEISMADLCKPTIEIGQKCETFPLAQAAKKRILEKKADRRKARERARELRIPYARALREVQGDADSEDEGNHDAEKTKESVFDQMARASELANNNTNLKLAVVEGQIQLDQESVVRSRGAAPNSDNRTVEVENPFENPITANSYSKKAHTDAWTKEEMVELYKALSTWGTDFTFIAQLFPYRTRRQIKNKFTLEEKNNPQLVELALRRKLPPNFDEFCASASTNTAKMKAPMTIDDFNREIAELKRDHEQHMREITAEREKAIKEDLETNRKREIEIRTGAKPMTKAERARMIRQNEVVVGEIEDVKRIPRENPEY